MDFCNFWLQCMSDQMDVIIISVYVEGKFQWLKLLLFEHASLHWDETVIKQNKAGNFKIF